ncbi:hypothetical protein CyaNS01_00229 [Cyanobium sp. NS01]|nr:hypothetical protein CyaNS01_00229 [Cyanobium sp. NS01]
MIDVPKPDPQGCRCGTADGDTEWLPPLPSPGGAMDTLKL